MKISVITPAHNSGDSIKRAILSVLSQDYSDFEHIVVDGNSSDKTVDILKQYDHLKWISEPDNGQVDAMNKGFRMATGDIMVYLNADDYFVEGAFSAIIPHFNTEVKIVMGKVLVRTTQNGDVHEWINNPKTDFASILRHWEPDAFCVNPVGYFYRREVQENIPFNSDAGAKHDLEFLMQASLRYDIHKIDRVLGVFVHDSNTQTAREQQLPTYWRTDNFPFVNRLVAYLPESERPSFYLNQESGYQLRRHWTVREVIHRGDT
jgi:glycosyltransferase involved in cell wall biosynthesis